MTSMENRAGYKKTKLGWIPEDWEVSTVENAFDVCNSGRKPISQEVRKTMQGIYPYYGPTKIQDHINEFQFEGRYALIAEDGDHFLKYSEKPMTQMAEGQFNVNNHAHAIEGKTNQTITDWFFWFFMNRNIYSHLTRQGAGRYKLNKKSLQQLKVLVPPLPEQQKISTILSTWDKAIDKLNALIDAKEEQKKGLMQRLLTGRVRLKGFYQVWSKIKLGEVFEERRETGNTGLELLSIGSKGVYPQSESNKKDTSNSNKDKYKRICKGDIGYNTMRMWQGRSAISTLEGIVSPAYTIVTPKEGHHVRFYGYLFHTPDLIHRFWRYSQGLVGDTLNCKFKSFSKVKVLVPPTIEEQMEIATVLDQISLEIKTLEKKRKIYELEKKGLMQQLLTGRTRVKV